MATSSRALLEFDGEQPDVQYEPAAEPQEQAPAPMPMMPDEIAMSVTRGKNGKIERVTYEIPGGEKYVMQVQGDSSGKVNAARMLRQQ